MKKIVTILSVMLTILLLLSLSGCIKSIDELTKAQKQRGELVNLKLTNFKGIPKGFGPLTAVTASIQDTIAWAQLWFVDDSSTIRMVRIEFHNNLIDENVLVIPRN